MSTAAQRNDELSASQPVAAAEVPVEAVAVVPDPVPPTTAAGPLAWRPVETYLAEGVEPPVAGACEVATATVEVPVVLDDGVHDSAADVSIEVVAETPRRTAVEVSGVSTSDMPALATAVLRRRSFPVRCWLGFAAGAEWLFGLASLFTALALLAAIPLVQFLSLGYLLEASGRIARTGRVRSGFFGIRRIARVGSLVLGSWLTLFPLRLVAEFWYSAQLIDARGGPTILLRVMLLLLTSLFVLNVVVAWFCGGKLRHFFWPLVAPLFFTMWIIRMVLASASLRPMIRPVVGSISPRLLADLTDVPPLTSWFPPAILWAAWRQGGMWAKARDAVWEFVVGLRLPYFAWLGARGFAGAVLWLCIPALMMIGMTKLPALVTEAGADWKAVQAVSGLGGLGGFLGAVLMALVLIYLPFLQAHFASENRLAAMFEVGAVRRKFQRAPLAFWFALFITLLFALPLYLLKIEYTPKEILWVPNVVFVLFIYPARLLTGWALARAGRRETPRFSLFRWLARLAEIPVVAVYVFVLFFTQYVSWDGAWSLLEQHPFLLPAPFFGL